MNKKDEILLTALKLFSEEGYDNVGVQRICDVSEVKKPTLYHYFGNKEGLLEELLMSYFSKFIDELNKLCVYKNDITNSLDSIVFHYFEFVKNNPQFYRLVLNLSYAPEESLCYKNILSYSKEQYKLLENLFNQAENQHGNMRGRSKVFSFTFLGIINSAISYYFFTKDNNDLSFESAQKICKQFRHGIFS